MKAKILVYALLALILTAINLAEAHQQEKVAKIGELLFRSRSDLGLGRTAFRQRLRELGYVEGKSIAYNTRSAEGKLDRFPDLAGDLVRLRSV